MIFVNGNISSLLESAKDKKLVCYGAEPFLPSICDVFESFDLLGRIDFITDFKTTGTHVEINNVSKPLVDFVELLSRFSSGDRFILFFTSAKNFFQFVSIKYQVPEKIEFYIGEFLSHNPPDYNLPGYSPEIDKLKIPKILHYCWFGGNPMTPLMKMCIESWKRFCPDYEIIEWNEKNYDVTKNQYMYDAYNNKKWAFVSDYARLDVIYQYGGVYIDADVELFKPIDRFLCNTSFCGLEAPGIPALGPPFGAVKGDELLGCLRDIYDTMAFVNADSTINLIPNTIHHAEIFTKLGLTLENKIQMIKDMTIYPTDVFCPMGSKLIIECMTENTHAVHHYEWSWGKEDEVIYKRGKAKEIREFLASFCKADLYQIPLQKLG